MGHLAYLSKSDAWIQAENPAPGPSESTEPPIRFFLQVPRCRLPLPVFGAKKRPGGDRLGGCGAGPRPATPAFQPAPGVSTYRHGFPQGFKALRPSRGLCLVSGHGIAAFLLQPRLMLCIRAWL